MYAQKCFSPLNKTFCVINNIGDAISPWNVQKLSQAAHVESFQSSDIGIHVSDSFD